MTNYSFWLSILVAAIVILSAIASVITWDRKSRILMAVLVTACAANVLLTRARDEAATLERQQDQNKLGQLEQKLKITQGLVETTQRLVEETGVSLQACREVKQRFAVCRGRDECKASVNTYFSNEWSPDRDCSIEEGITTTDPKVPPEVCRDGTYKNVRRSRFYLKKGDLPSMAAGGYWEWHMKETDAEKTQTNNAYACRCRAVPIEQLIQL